VIGVVIIVFVLLIALPVAIFASGAVVAAILGQTMTRDAEMRNEGSELIELNR